MSLARVKPPSLWDTIPSGLKAGGDVCGLDRYEESFDSWVLDTDNIGAVTSGLGALTLRGGLFVYSPNSTDAAMWYLKAALSSAAIESYTVRFNITDIGTSGWPFMVKQGASAPVINTPPPVIDLAQHATDLWALRYRKADGSFMYWNHSLAQWQAASVTMMGIDYTHAYEVVFGMDGLNWIVSMRDLTAGTDMFTTAPVAWADMYDDGNPYYLCGGDYATTGSAITMTVVSVVKNYPLAPQEAVMGQIAVNAIFEQFPVSEDVEAGASIVWRYNKDGEGWVQPGAGGASDVEAALAGLYIGTLDLKAMLSSDSAGAAGASFDINGGVMGPSDVSSDRPGDMNFVEVGNAIIARLKDKVPGLRTVEPYKGQVSEDLTQMPIKTPAALVLYGGAKHREVDGSIYEEHPEFSVMIVTRDPRNNDPSEAYSAILDARKALVNYRVSEEMEGLRLLRTDIVHVAQGFFVYGLTYETSIDMAY